jgi:hypothetical protein
MWLEGGLRFLVVVAGAVLVHEGGRRLARSQMTSSGRDSFG